MEPSSPSPKRKGGFRLVALAGWMALCFAAAATGALVDTGDWYGSLKKPAWNPPSWLFGPVWSTLYTMMAVSAWLVWKRGGWSAQSRPLVWFLAQWFLNALWTPLFFGLHRPDLAFAEILLLWTTIAVTLSQFWRVSRTAAWLLVPYLLWVSFATMLNYVLWRMNA